MKTPSPLSGRFETVNPDWRYTIYPGLDEKNFIHFDAQKDGRWLASRAAGKPGEIKILPAELVVKLLNEALVDGLILASVHLTTHKVCLYHAAPAAEPAH